MDRLLWVVTVVACGLFLAFPPFDAAAGGGKHRLLALDGWIVKWGKPELGAGATVTYALAKGRHVNAAARNCSAIDRLEQLATATRIPISLIENELSAAFGAWARVANLRFQRIEDIAAADIVIGTQVVPRGRAFANVSPRRSIGARQTNLTKGMGGARSRSSSQPIAAAQSRVSTIDKALICFNAQISWKVGFDGDLDTYDLRHTFMHEIGHAIGLDHPGSRVELMDFRYTEQYRGLRAGDVMGAIRLYGPRRAGTD